jgi:hypothetical protein
METYDQYDIAHYVGTIPVVHVVNSSIIYVNIFSYYALVLYFYSTHKMVLDGLDLYTIFKYICFKSFYFLAAIKVGHTWYNKFNLIFRCTPRWLHGPGLPCCGVTCQVNMNPLERINAWTEHSC